MIIRIILTVLTVFMFQSRLLSQELESWHWAERDIHFSSINDMEVVVNKGEEFEAENENIKMYFKASGYKEKDKNELAQSLRSIVSDFSETGDFELLEITNEQLEGYYCDFVISNRKYIVFHLGNKKENVKVVGVITYNKGWERTAIELVRNVYLDR